jgi:hypothetical protein
MSNSFFFNLGHLPFLLPVGGNRRRKRSRTCVHYASQPAYSILRLPSFTLAYFRAGWYGEIVQRQDISIPQGILTINAGRFLRANYREIKCWGVKRAPPSCARKGGSPPNIA